MKKILSGFILACSVLAGFGAQHKLAGDEVVNATSGQATNLTARGLSLPSLTASRVLFNVAGVGATNVTSASPSTDYVHADGTVGNPSAGATFGVGSNASSFLSYTGAAVRTPGMTISNEGNGLLGIHVATTAAGSLSTNANQFGASVTLTLKDGVLTTNELAYQLSAQGITGSTNSPSVARDSNGVPMWWVLTNRIGVVGFAQGTSTVNSAQQIYDPATGRFQILVSNNVPVLTILGGVSVGIGTTNPAGLGLDVRDTVVAGSLRTTNDAIFLASLNVSNVMTGTIVRATSGQITGTHTAAVVTATSANITGTSTQGIMQATTANVSGTITGATVTAASGNFSGTITGATVNATTVNSGTLNNSGTITGATATVTTANVTGTITGATARATSGQFSGTLTGATVNATSANITGTSTQGVMQATTANVSGTSTGATVQATTLIADRAITHGRTNATGTAVTADWNGLRRLRLDLSGTTTISFTNCPAANGNWAEFILELYATTTVPATTIANVDSRAINFGKRGLQLVNGETNFVQIIFDGTNFIGSCWQDLTTGTGPYMLQTQAVFTAATTLSGIAYTNTTIAGVGGANTNFTGQAADSVVYIDAGTTNVNFVAIMPGAAGVTYFPTYVLSNLTATARQFSFSSATNQLYSLQQYDGITLPITITNKHRAILSVSITSTQTFWALKQCTNGF